MNNIDTQNDNQDRERQNIPDPVHASIPVFSGQALYHQARRFDALADETRLAIMLVLSGSEKPLTGQELADAVGKKPNTISYHLRPLRDAELIGEVRLGNSRLYSIEAKGIGSLVAYLLSMAPDALRQ